MGACGPGYRRDRYIRHGITLLCTSPGVCLYRVGPIPSLDTPSLANDLDYDPEHVLPYMCDPAFYQSRNWVSPYAGCRRHTFELLCKESKRWFHGANFPTTTLLAIPIAEQEAKIDAFRSVSGCGRQINTFSAFIYDPMMYKSPGSLTSREISLGNAKIERRL